MALLQITDSNFKQEVLESALPVLVDFTAAWCGPCKMLAPILEDIVREYGDKIKIGKLDVDANPKTATYYGIMSIPTMVFFKNGKVINQIVGALSRQELKKQIEANL
ncbi:MAG: thioredoxin [Candidatus Omnitrophota bacterium]